jgi:uncharacterized protein YjbJ (UPF0337 family)
MNWDQIEGKWTEIKGRIRSEYGEITDDELEQAKGDRDQLLGLVQSKYGMAKAEAEKEVDKWLEKV